MTKSLEISLKFVRAISRIQDLEAGPHSFESFKPFHLHQPEERKTYNQILFACISVAFKRINLVNPVLYFVQSADLS